MYIYIYPYLSIAAYMQAILTARKEQVDQYMLLPGEREKSSLGEAVKVRPNPKP